MTETHEKRIPLVEVFGPTIQGEGSVIGQQTYFLRFGLCDSKCVMCDSMHAVDPRQVKKNAEWLTQFEIAGKLEHIWKEGSTRWVTFSGGNPCIHDLGVLVALLKATGWNIAVETQGTVYPEWLKAVDVITISPKGPGIGENTDFEVLDQFMDATTVKFSVLEGIFHAPECVMKVVVFDQRDLEFAASVYERYASYVSSFFLSQGNPYPPGYYESEAPATHLEHIDQLLKNYRMLFEDISVHPVLSKTKFLPQWHLFVWGNDRGH